MKRFDVGMKSAPTLLKKEAGGTRAGAGTPNGTAAEGGAVANGPVEAEDDDGPAAKRQRME